MAVKLPAIERAKIRLGDFDYTMEMLLKVTAEIEAEDAAAEKTAAKKSGASSSKKILENGRRGRGRPKKIEGGKTFSIWIGDGLAEKIFRYAADHDQSMSEVIRSTLEKKFGGA